MEKMFIKVYQDKYLTDSYVDRLENLEELIKGQQRVMDDCMENEGIFIQLVMMTEEEFQELPEFTGF